MTGRHARRWRPSWWPFQRATRRHLEELLEVERGWRLNAPATLIAFQQRAWEWESRCIRAEIERDELLATIAMLRADRATSTPGERP